VQASAYPFLSIIDGRLTSVRAVSIFGKKRNNYLTMATDNHLIVVSSENSPYLAWQTKLFYFSCLSRLKLQPLIIVHDLEEEWCTDFKDILRAGGVIRRAPNYRARPDGEAYPPRNTAGTLLHAAEISKEQDSTQDGFFVLCDPDMIFLRAPNFPSEMSAEYYAYMDYSQARVGSAAERLGIQERELRAREADLRCGVPYVIPVSDAELLAGKWLAAIDAFYPPMWTDVMYAFGLAAVDLNLKLTLTNMVATNCYPETTLSNNIIHYCYGSKTWSKRDYLTAEQSLGVWDPVAKVSEGTVEAEIISQIKEASEFYRTLESST
jgi:hypothetical protein